MTREEILDWLCRLRSGLVWFDVPPKERPMFEDALSEAIESLSAEPCDDAISRQAVMDFIRGLTRWCVRSEDGKFNNVGLLYDDVMFGLDRLPSVTPKQKMGRWLAVEDEDMNTVGYYCSECDLPLETEERTPFCPNCGAKMESEDQK